MHIHVGLLDDYFSMRKTNPRSQNFPFPSDIGAVRLKWIDLTYVQNKAHMAETIRDEYAVNPYFFVFSLNIKCMRWPFTGAHPLQTTHSVQATVGRSFLAVAETVELEFIT